MTGLFTNTGGPAVAREGSRGGAGSSGPGPEGIRRAGHVWGGDWAEGTWRPDRCCFLSISSVGSDSVGARAEALDISVPGEADCLLETMGLGAPSSGTPPLGEWPLQNSREGALGRPRAEVTAAEFLPGRFPAPPQCPCQGGGREFAPARRNVGASSAITSQELPALSSPSVAADLFWVS